MKLEIKSLPENSFASFIEEGKYDIIYQNYDRLGGNGAQDYVSVFFKTDEIDSLNQKSIDLNQIQLVHLLMQIMFLIYIKKITIFN
ncbi:hypothetical protein ONA02_05470 [Mycoplasmopsis felis]|uniref:hypothetical protein n=1 Tax=Mycoplasmopsis felis TaxID=33923 RepID=UPI0021E0ABC5|nr:hypothetical protein [Mycoplasmopsis felis]MCU9932313.1 hypothetical protein [Mycoplasmopsis felis]WAM02039.1 hypothetical protein ONA02_05470 [Mycoplasmopsis felis]